jgi:hypothetical protein
LKKKAHFDMMMIMQCGMDVIARHLGKYNAITVINNKSIGNINKYAFVERTQSVFLPDTLYIVDSDALDYGSILNNTANFLLISGKSKKILDFLDNGSNGISVPDSVDSTQLYKSLNACCETLEKFYRHTTHFLMAVTEKESLEYFIELISHVMGNPVVFTDHQWHTVITSKTQPVNNSVWDTMIGKKDGIASHMTKTYQNNYMVGAPYPLLSYFNDGTTQISVDILEKGSYHYWLAIFEENCKFSESDLVLAACVSNVLKSVLSDRQSEIKDRAISFFCDVISGKEIDSAVIIRRANLIGFRIKQVNYLLLISGENKEIDEKNIYNPYYEIKKSFNALVLLYEHKIVSFKIAVVFSSNESDYAPRQQFLPFLESNKGHDWLVSISMPFSSVCDLKLAYSQCLAAESLGKQSKPNSLIYDYKDYMGPYLLKQASAYVDISEFCLPIARKIVEYDSANNTDYAATIHVYLCESQNLDATARKMFLHRNSIQ